MEHYFGLDVSLKETHICVVDGSGTVVSRGREATHPELVAAAIWTSTTPVSWWRQGCR